MTSAYPTKHVLRIGFAGLFVLFAGFGFWAATSTLSGSVAVQAVIDTGQQRHIVQHAQGGTVAHLYARDGDIVQPGDLILELTQPDWLSQHDVQLGRVIALTARKARLLAEQNNTDLIYDADVIRLAQTHPSGPQNLENERILFDAQAALHRQTLAQIETQHQLLAAQTIGLRSQETAVARIVSLVTDDLQDQRDLLAKGLTQASRVSALDQQLASHARDMAQLQTQIAQTGAQETQLNLNRIRIEADRHQKAAAELRDVELQLIQAEKELSATAARLDRLTLRAPVKGRVHGMNAITRGSVIGAGNPIFELLPDDGTLRAVADVRPNQIDLIDLQQPVRLVLSDFDPQLAMELTGHVSHIASDAVVDQTSGQRVFRVDIELTEQDLAVIDDTVRLQPGMSADAIFLAADRTLLAMLVDPLWGYFRTAFIDG